MAKRNIARTAIEGGRRKRCREEEHDGTVAERASVRNFLRKCLFDPEYAEDNFVYPRIWFDDWIDLDFDDKLSPVKRWLESKLGKPWNDTYSEICEKFDKRSLAGRHILEHIGFWVNMHRVPPNTHWANIYDRPWKPGDRQGDRKVVGRRAVTYSYYDYEIDDDGLLVRAKRTESKHYYF